MILEQEQLTKKLMERIVQSCMNSQSNVLSHFFHDNSSSDIFKFSEDKWFFIPDCINGICIYNFQDPIFSSQLQKNKKTLQMLKLQKFPMNNLIHTKSFVSCDFNKRDEFDKLIDFNLNSFSNFFELLLRVLENLIFSSLSGQYLEGFHMEPSAENWKDFVHLDPGSQEFINKFFDYLDYENSKSSKDSGELIWSIIFQIRKNILTNVIDLSPQLMWKLEKLDNEEESYSPHYFTLDYGCLSVTPNTSRLCHGEIVRKKISEVINHMTRYTKKYCNLSQYEKHEDGRLQHVNVDSTDLVVVVNNIFFDDFQESLKKLNVKEIVRSQFLKDKEVIVMHKNFLRFVIQRVNVRKTDQEKEPEDNMFRLWGDIFFYLDCFEALPCVFLIL